MVVDHQIAHRETVIRSMLGHICAQITKPLPVLLVEPPHMGNVSQRLHLDQQRLGNVFTALQLIEQPLLSSALEQALVRNRSMDGR